MPKNLVSLDEFGSPVPRQPAHLRTQPESGAYLWDSSRVPRRRPFIYFKPSYAIGLVPSLSGHALFVCRWHSLPRVHRHRASKPQCSSERVLPCQINKGQILCAFLSHTHHWYEVGMLKLPMIAVYRFIEKGCFHERSVCEMGRIHLGIHGLWRQYRVRKTGTIS